jgi:hypothetical protein
MANPSERATSESDRGTADRGISHDEETSRLNMLDRAGVRSIVQSGPHRGRLVFDPARRLTPPPSRVPTTTGEILNVERLPVNKRTPRKKPRSRTFPEGSPSEKAIEYIVFDEPSDGVLRPAPPLPKKFHNYPGKTYADKTFRELEKIKEIIRKEASGDTVLSRAIAGAFAAEFDRLGFTDDIQETKILNASQLRFQRDLILLGMDGLRESLYKDPSTIEKEDNLFYNDVGPANFRIATALYLIHKGWLQFEISDPKNFFPKMVRQLISPTGTVKAAAAWIQYGRQKFEELGVMEKLPHDLQAAILVHWYREGPKYFDRFKTRWDKNHDAIPELDKEDGYMHNRERILEAIR